ncbi:Uncharacterised protein [Chryseobacterium gleum]|uniref:Uncharacterized protein n=2 Tax=Chryseobacterium gleum TaxID=250 RepID=A0A3S4M821_CHRGE|nr:hypothetical protein [Chryseobacterium gleum]EFK37580.1 hypothetical protein HMPREF0204_10353 [Chryseobacterium gleum ATCC 35910]QQY32932.1 hypothetical protein I6I60_03850 [Chryseobacterium gleum]VEE09817.1 Uncharacterised protein [Chryseobacterium gleum]
MKNKYNIVLIWISIAIALLVIAFIIVYLFKLYIEYFPLGEKRNMDLFLIALAIVSVYYIVKWIIKKIKR